MTVRVVWYQYHKQLIERAFKTDLKYSSKINLIECMLKISVAMLDEAGLTGARCCSVPATPLEESPPALAQVAAELA